MKIRHKLTLRYTTVTAVIFSVVFVIIYFYSDQTREKEFFRGLTREAVTKANLYLGKQVDAQTMQSIYHNNRQFIDEVEVAIYTVDFRLLYHDAQEIDIIKETPELIKSVINNKEVGFYEGNFQAIALIYPYDGIEYVVTAAAYDGHGYAKMKQLTGLLLLLWSVGIILIAGIGYLLARSALRPVSRIVKEVDIINESNLHKRLFINEDPDELDELASTFNQMLDRLEQSFQNQKLFVSNVAHELRTPLAALIAELDVAQLREHRSDQEYKTILANALDDAGKLNHLVSGLLDLAKTDYEASRISKEELRVDELLLDARETVMKANNTYIVHLTFDRQPEEERLITVYGNAYLLKTAFVNLMENNCKYSDSRSSDVRISFDAEHTIIRFSDTGIGIPPEEIAQIRLPFYRASNVSHIQGQGIGLALTHKIVLLHKGRIDIRSVLNQGTSFTVDLPHIQ